MPTFAKHMSAIQAGEVTRHNIIGIRKALNAYVRYSRGYSLSVTAPRWTGAMVQEIQSALRTHCPVITGAMVETGKKLLTDKRNKSRLPDMSAGIVSFQFVGMVAPEQWGNHYPLICCNLADGGQFSFYNVPWQSGGNGPVTWSN